MKYIPAYILLLYLLIAAVIITDADGQVITAVRDTMYRVELHAEGGPFISDFVRGRSLPLGAKNPTLGYNATFRVMWHPDHLLAVGILTGYQQIVAENYVVPDSASSGQVKASLHTVPIMLDVSMQGKLFEVGVGLGGYIISTTLDDGRISHASRLELGAIFHAAHHWQITDNLFIGAEAILSMTSYRGILSVAPQIDVKYNLLTY